MVLNIGCTEKDTEAHMTKILFYMLKDTFRCFFFLYNYQPRPPPLKAWSHQHLKLQNSVANSINHNEVALNLHHWPVLTMLTFEGSPQSKIEKAVVAY